VTPTTAGDKERLDLRLDPAVLAEVQAVLSPGETVDDFVSKCVADKVAWRRLQGAEPDPAHDTVSAEEVLGRLEDKLAAARQRLAHKPKA
jgi:hypothetical protein